MDHNLRYDHPLFQELVTQDPQWWQNLKKDKEIYCDLRRDNHINFYYNGGSLMRLCWDNGFKAEIHCEFIPLKADRAYLPFEFVDDEARLTSPGIIDIQNFAKEPLVRIKKRIRKFYPNNSEKGIQGRYVTKALQAKRHNGYFIDTEFKYKKIRMDLVWVDVKKKKIAFVELKRFTNAHLFTESGPNSQAVDDQLKKYATCIKMHQADLLAYYDLVYRIKKKLGLLKGFSKYKSLMDFELLDKPILLVGDCNQDWIDDHAPRINAKVSRYAYGCVYQGPSTFSFQIPLATEDNSYRFDDAKETNGDPEADGLPRYSTAGLKRTSKYTTCDSKARLHKLYPELAQGAEVPDGPLGKIKLLFAEAFATWAISLPEETVAKRLRGKICKAGWAIWFLFDSDAKGEYLDYYAAHRMTNDRHVRIYEDGQVEDLPAIPDLRPCSEDPGEDARLKKEQHAEDLRVVEILEAKGFGMQGDEPGAVQIQRYQRLGEPVE